MQKHNFAIHNMLPQKSTAYTQSKRDLIDTANPPMAKRCAAYRHSWSKKKNPATFVHGSMFNYRALLQQSLRCSLSSISMKRAREPSLLQTPLMPSDYQFQFEKKSPSFYFFKFLYLLFFDIFHCFLPLEPCIEGFFLSLFFFLLQRGVIRHSKRGLAGWWRQPWPNEISAANNGKVKWRGAPFNPLAAQR